MIPSMHVFLSALLQDLEASSSPSAGGMGHTTGGAPPQQSFQVQIVEDCARPRYQTEEGATPLACNRTQKSLTRSMKLCEGTRSARKRSYSKSGRQRKTAPSKPLPPSLHQKWGEGALHVAEQPKSIPHTSGGSPTKSPNDKIPLLPMRSPPTPDLASTRKQILHPPPDLHRTPTCKVLNSRAA
jgi:hypothetical protein